MSVKNVNPEISHQREFIYHLPETIFFDTELTINDLRVYGIIRSFMDTRGDAYPSNNWIARRLNIHRTTAITCINRLIEKDYIVKENIKGHRHLRIKINSIPQESLVAPPLPPSSAAATPPSSAGATQLDQNIINTKNININNNICIISEKMDKELLALRKEHLQADDLDRTEKEFLKHCSHFLDNSNKDKYPLAARLKGLKAIIKSGNFEKPAGYDERKVIKSLFSPEETALMSIYQHALKMEKLGCKLEDFMPDPLNVQKAMKLIEKAKKYKMDMAA